MLPPWLADDPRVVHVERQPGSPGDPVDWPAWAPDDLVLRAAGRGIERPWRHQVEAAEALRAGRHVALSTGTASGKSLAYLLPILESTGTVPTPRRPVASSEPPADLHPSLPGLTASEPPGWADDDPDTAVAGATGPSAQVVRPDLADVLQAARCRRTTALYLAPTKALAHDQLRNAWALGPHGWRITALDGDSEPDERRFARDHATFVLTNPDMLHASVLPHHAIWSGFLGGLRYVVVDEAHRYRGVFGAHVALVLRRLRRLCLRYGASPTFLCASATVADPAETAGLLIGEPACDVLAVDQDGSPRAARDMALWQPTDSTDADVAMLLGRLVADGRQTLAFVSSRRAAEDVARRARTTSWQSAGALPAPAQLPSQPAGQPDAAEPPAATTSSPPTGGHSTRPHPTAEPLAPATSSPPTGGPGTQPYPAVGSPPADADPGAGAAGSDVARISAYRGGYLPRERRAIEHALHTGALCGVATTNALELGVDIAGMDAVVIGGYPGSAASLWQQAGRAGRRGAESTVVLVARNDPLDAYLFDNPARLFGAACESPVLHPENSTVLGPHLGAAAQEQPLTADDARWFGPTMPRLLDALTAHGTLLRRATGWYWPHLARAVDSISIRSSEGSPVEILEESTGRILGTVDAATADRVVHPGAVYLHQGEHWLITDLDRDEHEAYALATPVDYDTLPVTESDVTVRSEHVSRAVGRGRAHLGTVDVRTQVVAFLRRSLDSGAVLARVPLDLVPRTLRTQAVWFTLPASEWPGSRRSRARGGAHAVEHALMSLLSTVAGSDRGDVAGAFSVRHVDTDELTVFVYDTSPGGAGFAAAGYERAAEWLAAALDRLDRCDCETGCPRCCVTSGCPTANDDLDRPAAARLLRALTEVSVSPVPADHATTPVPVS